MKNEILFFQLLKYYGSEIFSSISQLFSWALFKKWNTFA